MSKGYECHLTFTGDSALTAAYHADDRWKFSRIEGDPFLGQQTYCYLTAWGAYQNILEGEMWTKIEEVKKYGLPLVRAKIEHIIFDRRY